ncbi:MAG: hypothetical protein HZA22_11045 [Nitrospirae bacterium]|nr:hypothetical protein [Nitrospirota bacterium]
MSDRSNNIPEGRDNMDDSLGKALGRALGRGHAEGACPPPEDLAALAEGLMTRSERDVLFAHLTDCERCREVYSLACETAPETTIVATEDAVASLNPASVTAAPRLEVPARPSGFRWQARYFVPAALAASILLVIVSWPVLTGRNKDVRETANYYASGPVISKDSDNAPGSPAPAAAPPAAAVMEEQKTPAQLGNELADKDVSQPSAPTGGARDEGRIASGNAGPKAKSDTAEPRFSALPELSGRTDEERTVMAAPPPPAPAPTGTRMAEAPPAPASAAQAEPAKQSELRRVAPKRLFSQAMPSSPPPPAMAEPKELAVAQAPASLLAEASGGAAPQSKPPARMARISLDERLKLVLGRLDKEVSDKDEIASLFKDLKLGEKDFRLGDVKKVVLVWPSKPGADSDTIRKRVLLGSAQADVSIGDGGVLTIRINRRATAAVGC